MDTPDEATNINDVSPQDSSKDNSIRGMNKTTPHVISVNIIDDIVPIIQFLNVGVIIYFVS